MKKNKWMKRGLALLLALAMVISMVQPSRVSASEEEETKMEQEEVVTVQETEAETPAETEAPKEESEAPEPMPVISVEEEMKSASEPEAEAETEAEEETPEEEAEEADVAEKTKEAEKPEKSEQPDKAEEPEEAEEPETQEPEAEEEPKDVVLNKVAFSADEGAVVTVNGKDVTNGTANAEDGTILFKVKARTGYEIKDVLVDGKTPARTTDQTDEYIIEHISTDETVVSVVTQETLADANTYRAIADGVKVVVEVPADALPKGARLKVTRFEEDSPEYAEAGKVLDLDEETGMAAMDLSFFVNGEEVEPVKPVKVSIDASGLLPEDADPSTLEVQHLVEKEGSAAEAAVVAAVEDGTVDEETAVAEFEVESFSTFTVTWEWTEQSGSTSSVSLTVTAYLDGKELDELDNIEFDSQDDELNLETMLNEEDFGTSDYLFSWAYIEYTSTSQGGPGGGSGGGTTTIGTEDDPVMAVEKTSGGQSSFIIIQKSGTSTTVQSSYSPHLYAYYTTPTFGVEITPVAEDEAEGWLLQATLSHAGEYTSVSYEWSVTDTNGNETALAYVDWDDETGRAFVVWDTDNVKNFDEVVVHVTATITREDGTTASASASYTLEYGDEYVNLQMTYGPDNTALGAGVIVTLTNTVTGQIYTGTTDENGQILGLEIEPGAYTVEASTTINGSNYSCSQNVSFADAGTYPINLNYADADKTAGALDSSKTDWNHVDVKLATGSTGSGVSDDVTLNLTGAVITGSDGTIKYTANSTSIEAGASDNEWQIYFYTGTDTTGSYSHTLNFATTDSIIITYTMTVGDEVETYTVTIDASTTYTSGTTYPANGQRAYKLYNYLYGTSYSSNAQLMAAGVDSIDIGGMSMMLVAAILCDSSVTGNGAGVVTGTAGMWGMDFALSIEGFVSLSTNWSFDLEKTYEKHAMTPGMFTFTLQDAEVSEDGTWSLNDNEEESFSESFSNSTAGMGINGNSTDTMSGIYIPYDDDKIQAGNLIYYYILSEDKGDEGYTTYDDTVFGIKVEIVVDTVGTSQTEVSVNATYYILTSKGEGTYTATEYSGEKITDTEDGNPTFHFVNIYSTAVVLAKTDEYGNTLTGAQFTLTAVSTDENGNTVYYTYDPGTQEMEVVNDVSSAQSFALENVTLNTPPDGTYTLTETDAPAGWQKLPAPVTFEMKDDLIVPNTLKWADPDAAEDENIEEYVTISSENLRLTMKDADTTTKVSVVKNWDDKNDENGSRPDKVEIQLTADGEEVEGQTLELTEENKWTGTFSDLPVHNSEGTEIAYSVVETTELPDGYVSVVGDLSNGVITVTNTYLSAAEKSVDVGDGTEVSVGDELVYTITYANTNDAEADITITDKLDAGLDFVSATEGGIYNAATRTVTWTLEDVAAYTEGYVTFTATVNETALVKDEVENTASVQVGDDPAISTNTVVNPVDDPEDPTKSVEVGDTEEGEEPDFDDNEEEVSIGDELTYKISYKNGHSTAADVTISDVLDVGLDFVEASDGGVYNEATRTITWTIGGVEAYTSGSVTFTATVNTDAIVMDEVDNTASVQIGDDPAVETNTVENPVDDPTPPSKGVNVGNGTEVKVGDTLTYGITYKNDHSTTATIMITDVLDEGLDFVSATDGGTYDPETRTVTWVLEDVAAYTKGYVTFTVTVNETALVKDEIENTASVQVGNDPAVDTNPVENPVEDPEDPTKSVEVGDTEEGEEPDFADDEKEVGIGDELTYKINYKNGHSTEATVIVTDVLDDGLTFVSAAPEGTYAISTDENGHTVITWTLENVKAYEENSVTFTAVVNEKAKITAEVDNRAIVQVSNDEAQITNQVKNPIEPDEPTDPEKSVEIIGEGTEQDFEDDGEEAAIGSDLIYKIAFYNNNNEAADIIITDVLDAGLTYIEGSASNGGAYDAASHTLTWTLHDVEAFTAGFVTFTATVNENAKTTAKVDNTASVQIDNEESVDTNTVTNPIEPDKPTDPEKKVAQNSEAGQDGTEVEIGDRITYEITYYNHNNVPAAVTITDELDKGVDYVCSSPEGSYNEDTRTVTWTLEAVPAFASGNVSITVEVNETALVTDEVTNKASVQIGDNNPAVTETVENPVDDPNGPKKSVDTDADEDFDDDGKEVAVGDSLVYEITYKNGHSTEETITITDVLDDGLTFVSATPEGTYAISTDENGHTVITWTIENVKAYEENRVTFTAVVNENAKMTAEVENQASVQVGKDDSKVTNKVKNPVPSFEELTLTKTAAGDAGASREYEFAITLVNPDGTPYEGSAAVKAEEETGLAARALAWLRNLVSPLSGEAEVKFENGIGTVILTAGESVTLLIPHGTVCTVTEVTTGADTTTVYDGNGNVLVQSKGTTSEATAEVGTIAQSTQLTFVNSYRSYFPIDEEIVTDPDDIFDRDGWVKDEAVNEYNAIEIEMTTNLPVVTPYDLANGQFLMNFHEVLDSELVLDELDSDFSVYIDEVKIDHQYYTISFEEETGDGCNFHVEVDLTALYRDGIVTDEMLDGSTEITIFFFADLEGTDLNGSYKSTIWYDIYDGDEWLYTSNESVVEVYTYEIAVRKYDASTLTDDDYAASALAGAVLGVYYDEACTEPVLRNGEAYTAVSGEDGYAMFYGLADGTYYIKEEAAPEGYQLSEEIAEVVLGAETTDENHICEITFANTPEPEEETPEPGEETPEQPGDETAEPGDETPEQPGNETAEPGDETLTDDEVLESEDEDEEDEEDEEEDEDEEEEEQRGSSAVTASSGSGSSGSSSSSGTLPQTGQLNWPIPFLFAGALILLLSGIVLMRSGKKREEEA